MGHNRPTHNKMLKRRRQKKLGQKQLRKMAKRAKKMKNQQK